ncbi:MITOCHONDRIAL FISSION PROTEIN ELM1 [Salix viminalis]|uniref:MITOCHONDRIAL FISSION PROTEIN ELM1 n=1 Tax=Salix viminalis TaxID=40686 RepID=A0A9Q0QK61_SALVM|nr:MITOCHONDRIAL FISSION PROTEIN ELM1 [Salix viminalis]
MKPIRLPEPPSPTMGVPEIFENGANSVIRRAVVIGNGFPGSENQSLGLVRSLGLYDKHVLFRVTRPRGGINEWLHWLPISLHKLLYYIIRRIYSYLRFITSRRRRLAPLPSEKGGSVGLSSILEADSKRIVNMARESYEKDGPLLVVASGRDTISVASSIKRLASEKVFLVQIQHPRSDLSRFDLVVTPNHDYYPLTPQGQEQVPRFLQRWITPREPPDEHVVLTVGALHQIDFAALRSAASTWHDEFAPLPKPLLVVNIGGPSCHCRYGMDLAKQLCTFLTNVLVSCGSVRISFSNRTPEKVSNMIIKELANNPKVYIWDGEGISPNPYMGHLAWGDAFVVTADSVSMISEACSTGKPVYVIGSERCTWKLADFHKSLRERGVVRPFTGSEDISESWSYPPLNDTAEAARRIHEVLAERGLRLQQKRPNTNEKDGKRFFVIANAIASGYLVLSVPFSIGCIVRPHAAGRRRLLIIFGSESSSHH